MGIKMTFYEFQASVVSRITELMNELENYTINPIESVPSFDDIKITEHRYNSYSDVVKTACCISAIISNAYLIKHTCIEAKHKLAKDTATPTKILNQQTKDLESLLQSVDTVLSAAIAYKDGLDSALRFYQNACYMFGGILDVKSSI